MHPLCTIASSTHIPEKQALPAQTPSASASTEVPERWDTDGGHGVAAPIDPPMVFEMVSKSNIAAFFARHAPHLDPSEYVAAATVFPMRANN